MAGIDDTPSLDDSLTPPGWLSFVQPPQESPPMPDDKANQQLIADAEKDPIELDATGTPKNAPSGGLTDQQLAELAEKDPMSLNAAPVQPPIVTPTPVPPEQPGIGSQLGDLGQTISRELHGGNPIGSVTYEQPQTPPLNASPDDNPLSPNFVQHQVDKVGDELPSVQDITEEKAGEQHAEALARNPYELAKENVAAEKQRKDFVTQETRRIQDENTRAALQDRARHVARQQQLQADHDQLMQQAKQAASQKIDPNLHPGLAQGLLNVVALTLGGAFSQYTGGRNLALEQLNKAIDNHIQTQRENISNQIRGINTQIEGNAQDAEKEAQQYRDDQAFRIGTYQRAMDTLQTKMQDFDPNGSQYRELAGQYQQIAGAQQKTIADTDQKSFENRLKIEGAYQKQQEIDETARQHDFENQQKLLKQKGGGVGGSATNPNYNVPIGIDNPFTGQPIMGKRELAEKGKDKGQWGAVNSAINSYSEAQRAWSDLERIGRNIDYHKNVAGTWDKTQATDVAEYDAATHKLVVYLTKALGDKLTAGQLEEQSKRIPALTKLLDQRDVGKMIADSKEEGDRDFGDFMTQNGIDPKPIIASARSAGAAPAQPSGDDALLAGRDALAEAQRSGDPRRIKDAQAAYQAAEEQKASEIDRAAQGKAAISFASTAEPATKAADEEVSGNTPAVKAVFKSRNDAVDEYNQRLEQFHRVQAEKVANASKLKGDAQEAMRKHNEAVAAAALKVKNAKDGLDAADAEYRKAITPVGDVPAADMDYLSKHPNYKPVFE